MIDEERQAEELRTELDHELAAVRATAQARERLIRSTAARTRARRSSPRKPLRLRPVLALPLAGALVAAVIAIAVVVPTLLQADTEAGVPAGGGGPGPMPGTSTSPTPSGPTASDSRPPAQRSTSQPESTAATKPTSQPREASPIRATPSGLRLSMTPAAPEPGQRVVLRVLGFPAEHGKVTVQWGDRSADDTVPGRCAQSARSSDVGPLTHSYPGPGSYRVRVILDLCGTSDDAELTVRVQSNIAPAPTR